MPHVTFTQDYRVPGAPLGYWVVQTASYYAAWSHFEPDLVEIHTPDGDGLPLLSLRVGGAVEFADGRVADPGPVAPVGLEELRAAAPREWAGGGGDRPEFSVRFRGVGGTVACRLDFRDDAVALTAEIEFSVPDRIRAVTYSPGSATFAAEVVNPGSNSTGVFRFAPDRPLYIRPDWFTPPPYCFCYRRGDSAFAAGIEAGPANQRFTRFLTAPDAAGRQRWILRFDSAPAVPAGRWCAPPLVFRFGASDPCEALALHARGMVESGLAPRLDRRPAGWWSRPIATTWFQQCYLASRDNVPAGECCTQKIVGEFMDRLEERRVDYGTMILDMGWSRAFDDWRPHPDRWPDLGGFIRRAHDRGVRILLWICPNVPNLPDPEVYRDTTGQRIADPLNPAWRRRVAGALELLLGDLEADGLKFDFTEVMPRGPRANDGPELHGLEYLYELFHFCRDAAKAANPWSLLDFQVAHPVFAGCLDMSRLNDFFLAPRQALRVMGHRARVAAAVGQNVLIDTDCPNSAAYLRGAPAFGVRSLYLSERELDDPERLRVIER